MDPYSRQVLQALRLNRSPGWHFAGHFLGLSYDTLSPEGAAVSMPLEARHLDNHGRPVFVALAVLSDVAAAAAIRGRVGSQTRLATVSIRLSFSGAAAAQRVHATSHYRFGTADLAMPTAVAALSICSQGALLCTGEASFAVLDNRRGVAPHPMARDRGLDTVAPLSPEELTGVEAQVMQRAREALATCRDGSIPFLQAFLDLKPTATGDAAECRMRSAPHTGNRVGDIQGGVLLGLAAHTSTAVTGPGWRLLDISAHYLAAGSGPLTARAKAQRIGRNLASVSCTVIGADGRTVLRSDTTLARQASSS